MLFRTASDRISAKYYMLCIPYSALSPFISFSVESHSYLLTEKTIIMPLCSRSCCNCCNHSLHNSASMKRFTKTLPPPYVAQDILYETPHSFEEKAVLWSGTDKSSPENTKIVIKGMRFSKKKPSIIVPLFLREILFGQICHQLKHPNLIGVLDAFVWPDVAVGDGDDDRDHHQYFFIAMILPFASYSDLHTTVLSPYLSQLPKLNPQREEVAKMFMTQVIEGCRALHEMTSSSSLSTAIISHRDIKPANLFLFENEQVEEDKEAPPRLALADYGLSRMLWKSKDYEEGRSYWTQEQHEHRGAPTKHFTCHLHHHNHNHQNDEESNTDKKSPKEEEKEDDSQQVDKSEQEVRNNSCHGECCCFTDIVGTRFYRAPELLFRDYFYSGEAVDCWACGCTLFECIAGGKKLFSSDMVNAKATVFGSETGSVGVLEVILNTLRVVPDDDLAQSIAPNGEIDDEEFNVVDVLKSARKKLEKEDDKNNTWQLIRKGEFVQYDWERIIRERTKITSDDDDKKLISNEVREALDSMLQFDPRLRPSMRTLQDKMTFFSSMQQQGQIPVKPFDEILKERFGENDDNNNSDRCSKIQQMLCGCRDPVDALSLIFDSKIMRQCKPQNKNEVAKKEKAEKGSSSCVIC